MSNDGSERGDEADEADGTRRILRFDSLRPGAVFAGRFEILETLGGGGAGEVFRAHDRLVSQDVALKILFPGTSDRDVARLRREVRSARALQHPGILRVHDMGEHDGLFYIVSEFLEGESLAERVRRDGPLDPAEAERVFREVLAALACAHDAGIVHRDVKPANIFLARATATREPRVVLLDFGLARPTEGGTLTQVGRFVGTPEYCAPEQIRGAREMSPGVDLYALGATLGEMLSGRPPLRGTSDVETLRMQIEDPLPRPSVALRGAPGYLQSLAVDLLQKDPGRRPKSAREVLRRLDRRVSSTGTRWRTAWRARSGGKRKPGPWQALPAAALLVAVPVIAVFLAMPTAVRVDGSRLLWQTRLGLDWHGAAWDRPLVRAVLHRHPWIPFPTAIVVASTFDRSKGRVLDADGRPVPMLFRVDALTGRTTSFWGERDAEREMLGHVHYAYTSPVYDPEAAALVPRSPSDRDDALALALRNIPNYPTRLVQIGLDGDVISSYEHPGRLIELLEVDGDGSRPDLVLAGGMNNLLGPRKVVVALRTGEPSTGQGPPYTGGPKVEDVAQWYLPLPFVLRARIELGVRDGHGVAIIGDGMSVPFDLERGVPLDSAQRGGLTPDDWAARRDGLMKALFDAAALAAAGEAGRGAEWLEAFAREAGGPPWAVSIPFHRAARLRMQAARNPADLGPALEDAERAQAAEPDPPRYGLLHAEIHCRMGHAEQARQELREWWTRPAHEFYSFEWMLLRWAVGEDPPPGELLPPGMPEGCGDWNLTIAAAAALRSGKPDVAARLLESPSNPATCWQSQWYLGLRAELAAADRSHGRFAAVAKRAEGGLLSGYPVPLLLAGLRERLDSDASYRPTAPEAEAAAAELGRLVEAARTNLEALHLLSFAVDDAGRLREAGAATTELSASLDEARAMLAPFADRWRPERR